MLEWPGMMLEWPGMMLEWPGMMLEWPGMMLEWPGMMLEYSRRHAKVPIPFVLQGCAALSTVAVLLHANYTNHVRVHCTREAR